MKVEFILCDEHITAVYTANGVPADAQPPTIWSATGSKRGPSVLHDDLFHGYEHADRIPERLEELAEAAEETGETFSEQASKRWPIIHEMHKFMFEQYVARRDQASDSPSS